MYQQNTKHLSTLASSVADFTKDSMHGKKSRQILTCKRYSIIKFEEAPLQNYNNIIIRQSIRTTIFTRGSSKMAASMRDIVLSICLKIHWS